MGCRWEGRAIVQGWGSHCGGAGTAGAGVAGDVDAAAFAEVAELDEVGGHVADQDGGVVFGEAVDGGVEVVVAD